MSITTCQVCGFIYDEWMGDTKNGIPKGTSLHELAGSLCNRCGMQGERHVKGPTAVYENMEADYYDQLAGKSGISFYCDLLTNGDPQQQVLEIGVGTGRIAVELCRKGIPVTGIDNCCDMLKIAEKKAKALLKHQPHLLKLIEMDIQQLGLHQTFSHIILPDGILQHFSLMSEQVAILKRIHSHLKQDGMLAVDIILPPVSKEWTFRHRKKLLNHQEIHVDIQGETSLTRQMYRYEATFEKFVQRQSKERYRVDRELSLMLPKEAALLLERQGFEVVKMVNNYQSQYLQGWRSSYLEDCVSDPSLKTNESLHEYVHDDIRPFKENVWSNGGYPFSGLIEEKHAASVEYWTIIAKKQG
ncbi:methyltransferase domain-containing protein [Bacillus sp. REN10]|uniref:methyltransferase domain-containing protein n=1 Tax=Bacillus sp. REN10 TaxID=2782541 RepID=UPI00193B775C|nr:methyltransferase domain-containing protein [Bacillus sp. REN10]